MVIAPQFEHTPAAPMSLLNGLMTITEKLPNHVLVLCLNYLTVDDILSCRGVCSSLRAAVDTDIHLRYKIELDAHSMINGPPSVTLPGARLERLLEYQWRWEASKWTAIKSLPLPSLPRLDGIEQNENAILTRGAILCVFVFLGGYFRFIQVPSHIRGLPHRQWDIKLGQLLTLDVDFDPYQDLLIVLATPGDDRGKIQLSVRRLTDGTPHPLAKRPLLASYNADQTVTAVRIFGQYVTMFMRPHFVLGSRLNIYNWRTGACISALWKHSIESITTISERFALMVELPNSNVSCLRLWVVDMHRTKPSPFICALLLPNMPRSDVGASRRPGYYVYVQSGPHSSFTSASSSNLSSLFSVDSGNRLVLVTFCVYRDEAFALFTLASRLVKLAEMCEHSGASDGPPFLPWEDWGPQNTRLVDIRPESGEHLCVHGTKAVIADGDTCVLYNFNQALIKRELSKSTPGEVPNGIVTEATVLTERISFQETVTTYLPYKSSPITSECGTLEGKLLHVGEDSIVLVPVTFDQDIQICSI